MLGERESQIAKLLGVLSESARELRSACVGVDPGGRARSRTENGIDAVICANTRFSNSPFR